MEDTQRSRIWRTRSATKIFSLASLVGAVVVEWMLVNVPVPSEIKGQLPAAVQAHDEIVTFTDPSSVTGGSFTFMYSPPTEAARVLLDTYFDNAQLSDQTLQTLQSLHVSAPSSLSAITYLTSGLGSASCATKLQVEPASDDLKSVEFSQSGSDISSNYRSLGIRMSGTVALVTLTSQGALQHELSPCRIALSVGNWKQSIQGFLPIKIQVPPGASFRFHWQNRSENSDPWKTGSSALPLLKFGSFSSDEFMTRAITISSLNAGTGAPVNPPSFEALSSKQSRFTVLSFLINQNQLEVSASGKGRARIRGILVRVNVLQRLNDYPLPSALFAAGNLALIGWVKRAFFPARRNQ